LDYDAATNPGAHEIPTKYDPTTDLEAAMDALRTVLEQIYGPCEILPGVSIEHTGLEKDYIRFNVPLNIGGTTTVLTVEPHGPGYACIDNRNGNTVLAVGETQSDAMWKAAGVLTA
jgi:hypothetical protein